MSRKYSLSRVLSLFAGLFLAGAAFAAQQLPTVEVYKSPYCGCCTEWVKHMEKAGFKVKTHDVQDVPAMRRQLGMPERYGSCHTAKVGDYLVEGHVPADDVKRLLAQKPQAVGLAAPGMPQGSPGMETSTPQPYDTLLVGRDGKSAVFARH